MVKIPFFYKVLRIHGGCLGFLPSTVSSKNKSKIFVKKLPGTYPKKTARLSYPKNVTSKTFFLWSIWAWMKNISEQLYLTKKGTLQAKQPPYLPWFFVLHVEGIFLRKHQQFITKRCVGASQIRWNSWATTKTVGYFPWNTGYFIGSLI